MALSPTLHRTRKLTLTWLRLSDLLSSRGDRLSVSSEGVNHNVPTDFADDPIIARKELRV